MNYKQVKRGTFPCKAINKLCKKKAKYKKEIPQKITDFINEYLESKCVLIDYFPLTMKLVK